MTQPDEIGTIYAKIRGGHDPDTKVLHMSEIEFRQAITTMINEARIDELKKLNFQEASGFLSGGNYIVRQGVVTRRIATLSKPIDGEK